MSETTINGQPYKGGRFIREWEKLRTYTELLREWNKNQPGLLRI